MTFGRVHSGIIPGPTPYYEDDATRVFHGRADEEWPVSPGSVSCVVFSPPYNVGIDYADHQDRLGQEVLPL